MAALHQQMSPCGQILGRINPEHMGLHALLGARTHAEREVGIQEGRTFSRAGVDQPDRRGESVRRVRTLRSAGRENDWACMFIRCRAKSMTESCGRS